MIIESITPNVSRIASDPNGTAALISQKSTPLALSIVVPTRNESGNVVALLDRIHSAVTDLSFEVIFVDDSTDNTVATIQAAKTNYPFQISVIARPAERRNGLGMAVVEGMKAAGSEWVVVMDGDLQHPPEVIQQLMKQAQSTGADLVAASRLTEGGGTDGLDVKRKLLSHSLAAVSRLVFHKNLRTMTDPLTGFFLFRRSAVSADVLQPKGFKILLEILVRCPKLQVAEVPFKFAQRHAGASKANPREMLNLFQQMLELRFAPHKKLLRFLTVGVTGLVVNTALMYVFAELLGIHFLIAAILATQGSTLWNFVGTEKWAFKRHDKSPKYLWLRLMSFFLVNNSMLLLRGPILAIFVTRLGMSALLGNFLSLVVLTAVRYVIADKVIWGNGRKAAAKVYHYNIHDIIKVRSAKKLPELGYFAVTEPFDNPDIDVTISANPADFQRPNSINYDEVLGQYGFSIVINQSETRTDVIASPLIGLSPHVLYTNVVEAQLRWLFVRKGYALMHGACLAKDGKAVFVTAQTDTGKTTTILHTLRENLGMQFLSDDMTIVAQDGRVFNYPKPLTISLHTLRAVKAAPLTVLERIFLQVQSRLHSRGGRKAAMWLSESLMPAATLNAIVQKVIPPPKYMVHRLIPKVTYVNEAKLSHIVLIERGPDYEAKLNEDEKAKILVANAEDAYGFPPYPSLAHQLSQWHGVDLHQAETAIVTAATKGLPAVHLRRSEYDWYKQLPRFAQESEAYAAATV
jgi:dolichol-phosphate mannosyltransferase